jgi:hypothetical protein
MQIGDIVKILDVATPKKKYILCTIIDICKKKSYNMYICEAIKTKSRMTFTDMDLNLRYDHKGKIVELLW